MAIDFTFERKKQLFKSVTQLHYLTLELAKLLHRFFTSEELIKEVLEPQFSAAFKQDIAKTARMCGRGKVHPYIETLKAGWVPFIRQEALLDICFRNRGAFIDTDYLVSGEAEMNSSELVFLGKLNFFVATIAKKESEKEMYGWHAGEKYQQSGYMGFGQENSKHPASFGNPHITMLLLHYLNYSEEACRAYALIKEFRTLKSNCMQAGASLFAKNQQKKVAFEANALATTVRTSIELPGRWEEVAPDYWGREKEIREKLESSCVFVGEFLSINASNQKKLEELESYLLTFDFSSEEIVATELEVNGALLELGEIRQLLVGFFELYKNQILVAAI